MVLTKEQTRIYWALMESIWFTSDRYRPYMTRLLTVRACSIVCPEATVYDCMVIADYFFQLGMCKE